MIEVITLTGTLTHPCEYRQTRVRLGDVIDQLHHVNGFAHTGTTEQSNLTALGEWANQVDHLNARFQQLLGRA